MFLQHAVKWFLSSLRESTVVPQSFDVFLLHRLSWGFYFEGVFLRQSEWIFSRTLFCVFFIFHIAFV